MPLTLHQPKGMVGIVDRPMIHYIIDELASNGIKKILLVTSPKQPQFKKYADYLQKDPEWKTLGVKISFAVQKKPIGSADALLKARRFLGPEPFLLYFCDDLLDDQTSPTKNFLNLFQKFQHPILILEKIPKNLIEKYGVVKAKKITGGLYQISDIVEKPKIKEAPSNIGAMGRYLLTPEIFKYIYKAQTLMKDKKEIAVADALKLYFADGGKAYGWIFKGEHFDAGSKIGILKAQVHFGLKHPEFRQQFLRFLKNF